MKQPKEVNIQVICINDSARPEGIPISKWPVKGKPYTITSFMVHNIQGRLLGVTLAEINLDGCAPYETYAAHRFGIPVPYNADAEAQSAVDRLMKESLTEIEAL